MSEQIMPFSTGGFVVHKVYISGSQCKFSAWYDENGKLVDAERIDARGVSYPATTKQRAELNGRGRGFLFRAFGR